VPTSPLKIGVDGGGSKTECVLIDAAGAVLARHVAPGSNPSVIGGDQARLIVTDALCALLTQASLTQPKVPIEATLLCMAGARTFWKDFAASLTDFGRVTSIDDSIPILEIATHGDPGLVLHSGTGSFVAARAPDNTLHYAGGLGWRFGDAGSGYEIGERAVARALLEAQGWAAPSRLGPTVRDHAELPRDADAAVLTRYFYQHPEPNRLIASLAPAILRLASEGDMTAHALVVESTGELVALGTKVAAKLFPSIPLDTIPSGLSGHILTHPLVVEAITRQTPLPLVPIQDSPIEGVRQLLMRDFAA
jgi:glucosamine kinase